MLLVSPKPAIAQGFRTLGSEIGQDIRYSLNNVEADGEDFLTAPLHIAELANQSPRFYYTLLGAGVALGGAFALDQTIRSRIRYMSSDDASRLVLDGDIAIGAETGLLYLYGLYIKDERARDYAITGGESALIAGLLAQAFKSGFGRVRPRSGKGAFLFFDHGESFVSGEATPPFALAAAVSEYAGNRWYVAIPAYSAAMTVGLGRMGADAHWFSDVVGSAILGIGMTEILLHLHQSHAENPYRFRIFPVAEQHAGTGMGISASF